jgi:Domain of unknown function (DUF4294)
MATRILPFLFFFFIPFAGMTQTNTTLKSALPEIIGTLVETVYYEGDTIPYAKLGVVTCSADRVFKNYRQKAAWDRLKYNVKKVYPYAILASAKLKEYDRVLATIPSESGKKAFMKLAEKQLKKEFSQELKNLSINQGRILIKLIDRETGKTTYDIVKNMRGSFSAAMWQGVAIVFNSSLKSDYDADGEEKNIELAIKMIEDGQF